MLLTVAVHLISPVERRQRGAQGGPRGELCALAQLHRARLAADVANSVAVGCHGVQQLQSAALDKPAGLISVRRLARSIKQNIAHVQRRIQQLIGVFPAVASIQRRPRG